MSMAASRCVSCSLRPVAVTAAAALLLAGCGSTPTREELEAAKNTFTCQLNGDRLVIRFDTGEARLLLPGGERTVLYQIQTDSGVRFSNGILELRGAGNDLQLLRHGVPTQLKDCKPIELPK